MLRSKVNFNHDRSRYSFSFDFFPQLFPSLRDVITGRRQLSLQGVKGGRSSGSNRVADRTWGVFWSKEEVSGPRNP